jgi:hypothetical protein
MHLGKNRPAKPIDKTESIWEYEARLKKEALEISRTFNHTKPIKYLLK